MEATFVTNAHTVFSVENVKPLQNDQRNFSDGSFELFLYRTHVYGGTKNLLGEVAEKHHSCEEGRGVTDRMDDPCGKPSS